MSFRPALALPLLAGMLAASGCVAFEHPPSAQMGCDPRLAGAWQPEGANSGVPVTLDAQCEAVFPPRDNGRLPEYRTTLRSFTLDGHDYLVFSVRDVDSIFGLEAAQFTVAAPKDSVFLLRYRIEGDRVRGTVADADFATNAVLTKRMRGRELGKAMVLAEGDSDAMTTLLRNQPALFDDASTTQQVRLRRATAKVTP